MNEPSAAVWKKLNEVADRLQKVSEQLIETNAINKAYHQALEQQRIKIETLEQDNHKAQGAILMLKWWLATVIAIAISGGSWSINSINQLKQDVAIIQSREDRKE
ncbi:hypothetical protein [Acinetobacter towneri]|uniref:Mobilization protein n=1 Tax=Acinetobacter towneri TaxID=202956 RepID=A0AB35LXP5_9GAMM|nr:hypothetical protein [Acinetobacter towneri]MDM1718028.1 hypothetical protein [Acinetobacter towneri]MDM1734842.1 hypothetical protein [Acinetobacter towneri]MDM1738068.1 hypothetical protein [Acinetobacter towneri]MDM1741655.1 hypothetical protein [Acinetobacter towneri]MDM1745430.1 hypothetical protein [Acinetobacter towneri]